MKEYEEPAWLQGIRAQVDLANRKTAAEAGQWTLGELLTALERTPDSAPVKFSDRLNPGYFHSYRGYYDHVAITRTDESKTVKQFLEQTRAAVGSTFEGWKGGDFTMDRSTPVWVATEGECPGDGIVGMEMKDDECIIRVAHTEAQW